MGGNSQNIFWELLLKEMDIIEDTVKNLDGIIHKIKYFAFTAWGGGLYLIAQHLKQIEELHHWLYLGTAIIPFLFWIIDSQWQKHLLNCTERKRNIAQFVNSADFKLLIMEETALPKKEGFPFYDPIACNYTINKKGGKSELAAEFSKKYLANEDVSTWLKAMFYKGSWLFYITMIVVSVTICFSLI